MWALLINSTLLGLQQPLEVDSLLLLRVLLQEQQILLQTTTMQLVHHQSPFRVQAVVSGQVLDPRLE